MSIGKILFEQRMAHRLSQEELANILNVSRQSVSKWETDAAVPDLDHLIKLCDTFHLSLDALTGRVSCDETVVSPFIVSLHIFRFGALVLHTRITSFSKKPLDKYRECGIIIPVMNIAELCKGSTTVSDSVCLGSNPSSAAIKQESYSDRNSSLCFIGTRIRKGR